jgi:hypothetical protein
MKTRRFIISTICVMFVGLGLFLWLIYGFPDHIVSSDPAPTFGEEVLRYVCMVTLWPFAVTSLILHGDPPLRIYWLLLWIATGVFWALIIELLFIVKRRLRPNKSLQPTATAPSVLTGT